MLPCLLFEDDELLVVNKPAGLNTHAPSPYAGEGLYEWLRHREPRWATLAIIHRLDKETSGVLVFAKTPAANRSLTGQFTRRAVRKTYVLLTDRTGPQSQVVARSALVRAGEKYVSRPAHPGGELAETRFFPAGADARRLASISGFRFQVSNSTWVEARPLTGRTHQIRVHAAEHGFPILGDTLYGGTAAPRLCLHAAQLVLQHPVTGREMSFRAPVDFAADARLALRTALVSPQSTNAFRLVHGASDGWPGWDVDRLGEYLLSQSEAPLDAARMKELARLLGCCSARGAFHKSLTRYVRGAGARETSPQRVLGEPAPERFTILENGLRFELSFGEGYSVGLFLDQRDNRRRLLRGHVAAGFSLRGEAAGVEAGGTAGLETCATAGLEVLNTFAYTCGFSVCAAQAGARTTSLDLSKKYLDWGKRNFALNGLPLEGHDFLHGDAFDWLRRLEKKKRAFDLILLDPPTFSQSKQSGVFRVEKDYGKLVRAALPLLKSGGVLFASTNAADWEPEKFLAVVAEAIGGARRKVLQRHYVPQPPDFPVSRPEPAYLKTVWLRVQ